MDGWLLIGNSRWHWAQRAPGGLLCRSLAPEQALAELAAAPGAAPASGPAPLAWAATGALPPRFPLDPRRRLQLADVPLQGLPPWLGIDRALAGWRAHRLSGAAVLVADAGTVLSLTRVSATGRFAGGRLLAGAALQLRAMAEATSALPATPLPVTLPPDPWPQPTAAAMAAGVLRGLAAAVRQAWLEACQEEPGCRLWLAGGDGEALAPLLGVPAEPALALRGLVDLRPG